MKTIEQLYNQLEKLLDTLGIPREIPKDSFYLKSLNTLLRMVDVQERNLYLLR